MESLISKIKNRGFAGFTFALICVFSISVLANTEDDAAATAYKHAYKLTVEGNYDQARKEFEAFLTKFPKSPLEDNTRFWLCYTKAELELTTEQTFQCFRAFINDYPQSEWANDAKTFMIRIATRLAKEGKEEYIEYIKSMRKEAEDQEVAMTALYSLSKWGDEYTLPALLELYEENPDTRIRDRIIYTALMVNSPESITFFDKIAHEEPNPKLRRTIITGLGRYGLGVEYEDLAAPVLLDIALTDIDVEIQKYAVRNLAGFPVRISIPDLIQIAEADIDSDVRKYAISRLSRKGGNEVVSALRDIALADEAAEIQRYALHSLAEVQDNAGLPVIIEIVEPDHNPELRMHAIKLLVENGDQRAIDLLKKTAFEDRDDKIQRYALFSLFRMPDGAGIPALIEIARNHQQLQIRKNAVRLLSDTEDPRAREALREIAGIKK